MFPRGYVLSALVDAIFIVVNGREKPFLSAYQRLMLISSASISSAVVMILDEAE